MASFIEPTVAQSLAKSTVSFLKTLQTMRLFGPDQNLKYCFGASLGRHAPKCIAGFVLAIGAVAVVGSAAAQVRFSPDDEAVQAVAEKAAAALEKNVTGDAGQRALAALAIVECGKRYTESVPRNSKAVKASIAQILRGLPKNSSEDDGPIANCKEVYYPAVALILLAEYDDQKYESEIKLLLRIIMKRQRSSGAFTYTGQRAEGDTSQMQYAALAMFVARQHQFLPEPEAAKGALMWLVTTQQKGGRYYYRVRDPSPGRPNGRPVSGGYTSPSIQSAGIGTAYLLGDLLQLSKRKKKKGPETAEQAISEGLAFPPGVSIYVKPRSDQSELLTKKGPLVNFPAGLLNNCKRAGNVAMEGFYAMPIKQWNYYYMYAFERYAYFREQAEGSMGNGKMETWYDDGVYHLMKQQKKDGMFPGGSNSLSTPTVSTSFAILFLVRSSEILVRPPADGELKGGQGFKSDTQLAEVNGSIQANEAQQDVNQMMEMLQGDGELGESDLDLLSRAMRKSINDFRKKDDSKRGDLEAFLRTLISDRNHVRRMVAVRFLAGEQDLGNVPALLYALGDPDYRIAYEAHNGLRLISRKIDSISLSRRAIPPFPSDEQELAQVKLEYQRVKDRWTEWYLKLRPDAKLLD